MDVPVLRLLASCRSARRRLALLCSCALAGIPLASCVDDTGPIVGSINVATATSGTEPDPDGYTLSVNGDAGQPIGANATLTLPGVLPGTYSVQLAGVASNCVVSDGDTRTVPVAMNQAVSSGGRGTDWTLLAAIETLFLIPVFLVTFFLQEHLLRGVTFGTVRK